MIYKNSQQQNPEPSSESQFQSLIETALDIVAILNHDEMIRYLSPSVLRITGYSPKELIGQNAFSFMHEKDGKQQFEVFEAVVSDTARATKSASHSFRFRHKKGHWVVLESVSTKLPDGPEPPGILVNARDVTERAQAYESMRETAESERRFAQEHEIIAEVGRIISSNLNIEDVFELFATEVRRLIKFDMIAASIVDSNQETTTIKYWSGPEEYREDFKTTIPVTGSFTAKVLSSGKPVIVQGPGQHEILQSLVHRSGSDHDGKVNSRLGLPIVNLGKIIGALLLFSSEPEAFSELDVAIADRVCSQIAGAISGAGVFADLK